MRSYSNHLWPLTFADVIDILQWCNAYTIQSCSDKCQKMVVNYLNLFCFHIRLSFELLWPVAMSL